MEDGNALNVIVLTKHLSHEKKIGYPLGMIKSVYGRFPKLVEALSRSSGIYNEQVRLCRRLEEEGRAVVIQPPASLTVSTYEKDPRVLNDLADRGYADGKAKLREVRALLARSS